MSKAESSNQVAVQRFKNEADALAADIFNAMNTPAELSKQEIAGLMGMLPQTTVSVAPRQPQAAHILIILPCISF